MRTGPIAAGFLALAAACGASLEEPRACVAMPAQYFPGLPSGAEPQLFENTFRMVVPLLDDGPGTTSAVLQHVEIRARAATAAFAGWQWLRVQALPPAGSGLSPLTILDRTFDPLAAPAAEVLVESDQPVELGPYFQQRALLLRLDVYGVPPEVSWLASMEACLSFERRVRGRRRSRRRARGGSLHPQLIPGGRT